MLIHSLISWKGGYVSTSYSRGQISHYKRSLQEKNTRDNYTKETTIYSILCSSNAGIFRFLVDFTVRSSLSSYICLLCLSCYWNSQLKLHSCLITVTVKSVNGIYSQFTSWGIHFHSIAIMQKLGSYFEISKLCHEKKLNYSSWRNNISISSFSLFLWSKNLYSPPSIPILSAQNIPVAKFHFITI